MSQIKLALIIGSFGLQIMHSMMGEEWEMVEREEVSEQLKEPEQLAKELEELIQLDTKDNELYCEKISGSFQIILGMLQKYLDSSPPSELNTKFSALKAIIESFVGQDYFAKNNKENIYVKGGYEEQMLRLLQAGPQNLAEAERVIIGFATQILPELDNLVVAHLKLLQDMLDSDSRLHNTATNQAQRIQTEFSSMPDKAKQHLEDILEMALRNKNLADQRLNEAKARAADFPELFRQKIHEINLISE